MQNIATEMEKGNCIKSKPFTILTAADHQLCKFHTQIWPIKDSEKIKN